MPRQYVPNAGDIVWLNFTPRAGREQAGHRPALVLSPASYNSKTSFFATKTSFSGALQLGSDALTIWLVAKYPDDDVASINSGALFICDARWNVDSEATND